MNQLSVIGGNTCSSPGHPIQHIVLIDDDLSMARMLISYLDAEGLTAIHAASAADGHRLASQPGVQLVLLDVMLPDGDGFALLRALRKHSHVPVIMLTIQSEVERRVQGLESGADDYVAKPFAPIEVLARIRSVLRRKPHDAAAPESLIVDDLVLIASARVVRLGVQTITCTPAEFELLYALVKTPGAAVGKEDLTRLALGRSSYAGDRGVDNLVHSLRRKLGPRADGSERFKAVRNQGYVYLRADATATTRMGR